jgi:hypothetical protein
MPTTGIHWQTPGQRAGQLQPVGYLPQQRCSGMADDPVPSVLTSKVDDDLVACTRTVPSLPGTATFDKPHPPKSAGHLRTQRTNQHTTAAKSRGKGRHKSSVILPG